MREALARSARTHCTIANYEFVWKQHKCNRNSHSNLSTHSTVYVLAAVSFIYSRIINSNKLAAAPKIPTNTKRVQPIIVCRKLHFKSRPHRLATANVAHSNQPNPPSSADAAESFRSLQSHALRMARAHRRCEFSFGLSRCASVCVCVRAHRNVLSERKFTLHFGPDN